MGSVNAAATVVAATTATSGPGMTRSFFGTKCQAMMAAIADRAERESLSKAHIILEAVSEYLLEDFETDKPL